MRPQSLTGGKTYLEAAVAFAVGLMKARVISSPSDEIAIVFYGTLQKKNESGFDYVYCWQDEPLDKAPPLRPPSADRIRRLSAFNLAQVSWCCLQHIPRQALTSSVKRHGTQVAAASHALKLLVQDCLQH